MNDFILYTDSACDLPEDMLKSLGIHYRSLTFAFEGESEHDDREVPAKDFYAKMRAGGVAKTAAINTECFREAFEEEIAAGHDILYIAFIRPPLPPSHNLDNSLQTHRRPDHRIVSGTAPVRGTLSNIYPAQTGRYFNIP